MNSSYRITKHDMALLARIFKFTMPEDIPLQFKLGDRVIRGIPAEFCPTVTHRLIDCNMVQYVVEGQNEGGLSIRAEYLEYRDFPVTEWVVTLTNRGKADTPIVSDVRLGGRIACEGAVLEYGNGDTCTPDGYHFFKTPVDVAMRLTPNDGTSCNGAFPYMTIHTADCEIRAAIGWPTKWAADITPAEGGITFACGQDRCHTVLHPGESFRTPRLNLMAYTSEDAPYRGINLWRAWYLTHILPRENGQGIGPKLCLHYFMADGKPEFTGATEQNQIHALSEYLRRGMKPDVWWLDAGWYPCNYDWPRTGTWRPDPARFPNGLAPLGKACEDNGVQLLLWFEPERVRGGEELEQNHSEWLLYQRDENGNAVGDRLLDLGNDEARGWLIDHVNALIKESHVAIYRQDFNFNPAPIWAQNEADDRIGMLENRHAVGYLAYWDALILANPGLWIDSCASGGRRNDLETMRRAVPLHYTDVGYGHHPIKQKQHREMFEWIPYFRAHNYNWDLPDGTYGGANNGIDEFGYQNAVTPAVTSMIEFYHPDEIYEVGRRFHPIWRKAAGLELTYDYYPLTVCRKDASDMYAMQFDGDNEGFIQIIRNVQVEQGQITLKNLHLDPSKSYIFTDELNGRTFTEEGKVLAEKGFSDVLSPRSGVIWFYKKV